MMRTLSIVLFVGSFCIASLSAQSPSDSIIVTFRGEYSSTTPTNVPGEFNGWTSTGTASQMTFDAALGAWVRSYAFKIKDPSDTRRRLGDSIWQYKIYPGQWLSDPLNPERNPADNNNSILRLTPFGWFQFSGRGTATTITRITIGVLHSNEKSIQSLTISVAPSQNDMLTTYNVLTSFDPVKRILDFGLPAAINKTDYIRIVARTTSGDSIVFSQGGYQIITMAVPSNFKQGVTLKSSNDSTGFLLSVPQKDLVLLRIAPQGTHPATAQPIPLRKGVDGRQWWLNLRLPNGTYEYLYELENGKQIYDPFGRQTGLYGTRFTVGPEGLTADDYVWKATSYIRPPKNQLVIYELSILEFAGGYYGKAANQVRFKDLQNLLPHFDSLGVNCIELMPINDWGLIGPSGFSWGYDISHHFALEPTLGTPRELKELIDAAHQLGIAVIIDVVFNHLNEPGPLWDMLPNETQNPYFKPGNQLNYNEDGLLFFKDLNHWNDATVAYVYESLKMWLDEYRVDGFRFDYTQGVGWKVDEPTKGILGWINPIAQEYPGAYLIAEHLPESPALVFHSGMNAGWHDSFRDKVFDEARFRNVTLTDFENLVLGLGAFPSNDTPSQPSSYANRDEPVNATVTHDEQSLIYEMTTFQGVAQAEAIRRDKLYATYIFTSLGIPMLWQGMEFSEPRGWMNDGGKLSYRPMQWIYRTIDRGKEHFYHYRSLAMQRRKNPALHSGVMQTMWRYTIERTHVWGFDHTYTNSKVMVVSNLSGLPQTITNVPWLGTGTWYDVFTQQTMEVTSTPIASLTIPAYTAFVFSNRSNADLGIITSVASEEGSIIPTRTELLPNYPNPFNPSTTIRYKLAKESDISLRIFDQLGREVALLAVGMRPAGHYVAQWDGKNSLNQQLPSGVYFVMLQAEGLLKTQKIMLMK